MRTYVIRRLLLIIPMVFIVSLTVFFLVRFVPGSAIDVIAAQVESAGVDKADYDDIKRQLGLDVPFHIQYGKWIGNIITHFDFGNSLISKRPILDVIVERIPVTLELSILVLCIGWLISLPLGIISAVRQDTIHDYILRSIAVLLIALPGFWIATMVVIYPSIWFGWSPPITLIHFLDDPFGNLKMFVLPAFLMGFASAGGTMRITRTMMLEVMRQDYIRTAWAKGQNERKVILKHALKNAFIPVITIMGNQLGHILGGAVIIETIFVLPGMGQLMIQSLNQRDYPMISALVLISSVMIMAANLLVDIAYAWLDPRIKYN